MWGSNSEQAPFRRARPTLTGTVTFLRLCATASAERDHAAPATRTTASQFRRLAARDRKGDQAHLRDDAVLAAGEQADAQVRDRRPLLVVAFLLPLRPVCNVTASFFQDT